MDEFFDAFAGDRRNFITTLISLLTVFLHVASLLFIDRIKFFDGDHNIGFFFQWAGRKLSSSPRITLTVFRHIRPARSTKHRPDGTRAAYAQRAAELRFQSRSCIARPLSAPEYRRRRSNLSSFNIAHGDDSKFRLQCR